MALLKKPFLSAKFRLTRWGLALLTPAFATALIAASDETIGTMSCPQTSGLAPHERQITILGTNDIHGGVDPEKAKDGSVSGGMAFWAGVTRSIREGISQRLEHCGGTLVVDAGDQFQGTLLSNHGEGSLMFAAMNAAGYDAVVPGNHDYDFGPLGWLQDRVAPGWPDQNPRGVIEKLATEARFPLLSANTYLLDSLVDAGGDPVEAEGIGCRPKDPSRGIEFALARRPSFLKPYVVTNVAGVRVAMIGIDNADTPKVTTVENVSDLCFRDELEAYADARAELEGKADLFVLIVHDGDSSSQKSLTRLLERLTALPGRAVDAVIAGHTHEVNNIRVAGVPAIQSGSGGVLFGRVDLVWDSRARTVLKERTRVYAGVRLRHAGCDRKADYCSVTPDGRVAYETLAVEESRAISDLVSSARAELAPLAGRVLGFAEKDLKRDRIFESALSDALTDALREASGADVALLNTGGIRENIPAGEITYEKLFATLPFGNHAILTKPVTAETLLLLLERAARTCGAYGALMQSGLRVEFERDCKRAVDGVDTQARLVRVRTVGGETLLDTERGIGPSPGRKITLATLDYLMSGGAGYDGFRDARLERDLGILREILADNMEKSPPRFSGERDGRWKQITWKRD